MKLWNRLFGKKVKEERPNLASQEEKELAPVPYDYGLDKVELFLISKDYGWSEPDKNHKKVILTNALDCKGKICFSGMVSAWLGTGHVEWEALLASWFVEAVVKAIEENVNEADITNLFNRDFWAYGNRFFTQDQVYNHLIKWFDVVEEDQEVVKLKFHII